MSEAAAPARRFSLLRAGFGLVLGLVLGWVAVVLSYMAYVEATGYFDREGAGAMAAAFALGPMAGIATGLVLAVLLGRGRRPKA